MAIRAWLTILCCSWLACAPSAPKPLQQTTEALDLAAQLANGAPVPTPREVALKTLAARPLRFEPNHGQIDETSVRFAALGMHEDLLVMTTGFAIVPRRAAEDGTRRALRVVLVGANPAPRIEPLERVAGVSHYYRGADPAAWQTSVPGYARVALRDVRPGVDLVLHGSASALEYDFEIAAGADPAAIELAIDGAEALELDANGDLQVSLGGGVRVAQRRPVAYQQDGSSRRPVDAHWIVEGDRARFAVAEYDRSRTLVIDPVVLAWSTYLGGSDFNSDSAEAIAVGPDGRVTVVGTTSSSDFPSTSGSSPQGPDAFVTVFEPDGQSLVYSTFLGGAATEIGTGVAVDASGRAFVTGHTYSPDFPTRDASQPIFGGDSDAFVTVLDADGALIRSTFLGGFGEERGGDIALDGAGRASVGGSTASPNFPATLGAYDAICGTDGRCNLVSGFRPSDLFAARYDANGALDYATFLGGESSEFFGGLAVDAAGSALVAGYSRSNAFPTVAALQPGRGGAEDAVLAKLSLDGSALVYATYLGGSDTEFVGGVAVDGDGNGYVTGFTRSDAFPLAGAYPSQRRGPNDVFVAKLPPDGSSLLYSLVFGGNDTFVNGDLPYAIAVDATGRAYVAGETTSPDFPLVQPRFKAATARDSYIAVLDAAGASLVAASYVSGARADTANALALDADGDVYIAGITELGFPVENAFQPEHGGGQFDAYVARLSLAPANLACSVAMDSAQYGDGDRIRATALRFANETGFDVAARFALSLVPPSGPVIPIATGSAVLAQGFDRDIAPVAITTVGASTPRGDYALRCEIADPATGAPYATGAATFTVQ